MDFIHLVANVAHEFAEVEKEAKSNQLVYSPTQLKRLRSCVKAINKSTKKILQLANTEKYLNEVACITDKASLGKLLTDAQEYFDIKTLTSEDRQCVLRLISILENHPFKTFATDVTIIRLEQKLVE